MLPWLPMFVQRNPSSDRKISFRTFYLLWRMSITSLFNLSFDSECNLLGPHITAMWTCISVHGCTRERVHESVHMDVHVSVYMHQCTCLYTLTCTLISVHACTRERAHVSVYMHVHVSVYMNKCIWMNTWAFTCISVHACTRERVHASVYTGSPLLLTAVRPIAECPSPINPCPATSV